MALSFFASSSFIFHVLLVLLCVQGGSARQIAMEHWKHDLQQFATHDRPWNLAKQDDADGPKAMNSKHVNQVVPDSQQHAMDDPSGQQRTLAKNMHDHPSSHMHHMDPSQQIFFTISDLKVGKIMPIYLPYKNLSASPHLLPREEADSIPFSLKQLPYLLEFFSFSQGSPQAKAMEDTLTQCELEPIKGETKFCATSLESMLDFTRAILGFETQIKVLTTKHLKKLTTSLQNYTILEEPKEIAANKMIACHTMPYPYAVFYCHCQESENKLFEVSLGGDNGERVEAVAVCHMDTSQWNHDHASFRVLSIKPGTSPVCHVFPGDNLVWVSLPASI